MRVLASAVALAVVLAGCLQGEEAPQQDARAVEQLGSTTVDGGVAGPSEAVQIAGDEPGAGPLTFHPYDLPGGRARAPAVLELPGKFETKDCSVPLFLDEVTNRWQSHEVSDQFETGDVAHFAAWLNWTNADDAWSDIHLFINIPGGGTFTTEDTADLRGPVSLNWTGQVYWRGDDDTARVGAACFYGAATRAIDYVITVRIHYAENVVPALTPVLVDVPEGATRLFVAGVGVGEAPVTSHYRVFAPDDTLVGEFALNSNEPVDAAMLPGPGEYVVLVDHTEGGFVTLGTDVAPVVKDLVPLDIGYTVIVLLTQATPGPAAATVPFNLPRVPLGLFVFPDAPDEMPGYAFGRDFEMTVEGPRGVVLNFFMEGFASAEAGDYGTFLPAGLDFRFEYDHHALAVGDHVATLDATLFRGNLEFFWTTYLRPGEEGGGLPPIGNEGGISMLPFRLL